MSELVIPATALYDLRRILANGSQDLNESARRSRRKEKKTGREEGRDLPQGRKK